MSFQDVWTYCLQRTGSSQHRIRLVKVEERVYFALSKFYWDSDTSSYLPTKQHYFIALDYLKDFLTGVEALKPIIQRHLNATTRNESAEGDTVGTRCIPLEWSDNSKTYPLTTPQPIEVL